MGNPEELKRENLHIQQAIAEVEQELQEVEAGRKTLVSIDIDPTKPLSEESAAVIDKLFQQQK